MISVKVEGGGTRFSIEAKGHANFNPGNDPVCAGVSTLCQSLLAWCANAKNVRIVGADARSGDFSLAVKGDAMEAFQMAVLGLKGIEAMHPANVSVDDKNFFGFSDAM